MCRAGICPEATQRKKDVEREREREQRKKQGGKRVEPGMQAFLKPTNGRRAEVQERDPNSGSNGMP